MNEYQEKLKKKMDEYVHLVYKVTKDYPKSEFCPLTAVCLYKKNELYSRRSADLAAGTLNMFDNYDSVIYASDYHLTEESPEFRLQQEIFTVLGLKK